MLTNVLLNWVRLENFNAAREIRYDFDGADARITGPNGVGKTTVADACLWLLFDKNTLGQTPGTSIKTLDENLDVIHCLDHSVEAEISVDGAIHTLKRTYREKWETPRNAETKKFTGHESDYWVNGVPCNETEFRRRVGAICPESRFRLLADPTYFVSQMKWQDRRKLLLEVCGDVTDADVIASDPNLAELPDLMGTHPIDDFRAIVKEAIKRIGERRKTIPISIKELRGQIPPKTAGAPKDPAAGIEAQRSAIRSLQDRRAEVNAGGAIADKTVQLRTLEGEMLQVANRLRAGGDPAREPALRSKREKETELQDLQGRLSSLKRQLAAENEELTRRSAALQKRVTEGKARRDLQYTPPEKDDVCRTCGQNIPPDQIALALREDEANFNEKKARDLEEIRGDCVRLKGRCDEVESSVSKLTGQVQEAESAISEASELLTAIVVPSASEVDVEADPEYAEKAREKANLRADIEGMKADVSDELLGIDAEIDAAQRRLDDLSRLQAAAEQSDRIEARIKELDAEEKTLFAQLEGQRHALFLTELFTRTKVSLLTGRINAKFRVARFKLFEEQVDGGLQECCKATYLGAPPSNGEAIKVGLDVIETLSEHFGFSVPIFVDNAEAVTGMLPARGQQIRLVVSEDHPDLRIETNPTEPLRELQEALL